MTQGADYDPNAEYIKEYVPELRGAAPEIIHDWNECSLTQRRNAAPEYPDPVVDHSERREQALAMFERAEVTSRAVSFCLTGLSQSRTCEPKSLGGASTADSYGSVSLFVTGANKWLLNV